MFNNNGKINILVVIIIVLVQVIILGGGYFFFIRDTSEEPPQRLQTLERTEVQPPPRPRVEPNLDRASNNSSQGFSDSGIYDGGGKDYIKEYALFNLGDLTIVLSGPETTYFVVGITFEYRQSDKKLPDEMRNKTPIFKDRLIGYFSRLTIDDIKVYENRDIFKEDILRIVNGQLLEGRITNVLFEQFVFQ